MPTDTRAFMFRKGDGNEGNFARYIVELKASDEPFAALAALLANEYIAGKSVRRYIVANTETDGEVDFGINATVYEGPKGEQAFGAAWLTAELQPLTDAELSYEREQWGKQVYPLRSILDRAALRQYRAAVAKKG